MSAISRSLVPGSGTSTGSKSSSSCSSSSSRGAFFVSAGAGSSVGGAAPLSSKPGATGRRFFDFAFAGCSSGFSVFSAGSGGTGASSAVWAEATEAQGRAISATSPVVERPRTSYGLTRGGERQKRPGSQREAPSESKLGGREAVVLEIRGQRAIADDEADRGRR